MLQHYLHEKFETWFKRRSPTTTLARLNIRNVYIFLSKEGVMFVLLLLITFVAGTNYANNLVLGFCFLLSSLFIISIHYTFAHLAGLQVKLIEVGNATQGDYVQVRLQVSSQAKQPHRQIYLSFGSKINQLNKPLQGTAQNDNLFSDSLLITQVQEPKIISLYLKAHERGRFDLPKLTVSTVYPLGILRAWSYVFLQGHGWIFPRALAYDSKTTQFAMSQKKKRHLFRFALVKRILSNWTVILLVSHWQEFLGHILLVVRVCCQNVLWIMLVKSRCWIIIKCLPVRMRKN